MKVRGAWIVALLVLASVPVVAHAQKKADLQPEIYFAQTKYDFGKVFQQEKYEHDFVVRNKGKADLVIHSVKPG